MRMPTVAAPKDDSKEKAAYWMNFFFVIYGNFICDEM
jgi:hypothetical protein